MSLLVNDNGILIIFYSRFSKVQKFYGWKEIKGILLYENRDKRNKMGELVIILKSNSNDEIRFDLEKFSTLSNQIFISDYHQRISGTLKKICIAHGAFFSMS